MEKKDPVFKAFLQKMKHPAVITFLILITLLIVFGLIVDYIRPEYIDPSLRMV